MLIRTALQLIVGLGCFLSGMQAVKNSFYQTVNDKLEVIIRLLTVNLPAGILTGILVTMIIQSSSATTVIIISLVNAGLLSFNRAAGVIMGANIGTTITVQLFSFSLEEYITWIIAVGLVLYVVYYLIGYYWLKYMARGILGFGVLFFGLKLLGAISEIFHNHPVFINSLAQLSAKPMLMIIAAALLTALIQSSSALTGIVVVLAKKDLINLGGAVGLALGSNVGTCVTAFIASLGSTESAKRVAWFHLLFNTCGVILVFPFLPLFIRLVSLTSRELPRQLANAHTIFNIFNTLLFIILYNKFILFTNWIMKGEKRREWS